MSSSIMTDLKFFLELGKESEQIQKKQDQAEFEFYAKNFKLTGRHHPLWTFQSKRAIGINGEKISTNFNNIGE